MEAVSAEAESAPEVQEEFDEVRWLSEVAAEAAPAPEAEEAPD